ncbi:hypothetical protein [Sporolactobacillus pectinivorans]|nr:hypothetical protein [Sporolactobacillus pectinivorans]
MVEEAALILTSVGIGAHLLKEVFYTLLILVAFGDADLVAAAKSPE